VIIKTAPKRRQTVLAGLCVLGLAVGLSACGDSSSSDDPASNQVEFSFLGMPENTTVEAVLQTIAAGSCATDLADYPLKTSSQPQASYDQQLQLLAGNDALPSLIFAANTPSLAIELHDGGYLVDIDQALTEVGLADAILPAAESVLRSLYGGDLFTLPAEFNIEGIWYNKAILAQHGIAQPTTWDELTAANQKLADAGVQPFAVAGSGGDGWNVTRLVGNHIFRSLGADAMRQVADGKAKLTDPEYLASAEAVAAWGQAGYFGPAPTAVDYATAMNTFLTGQAAFYYMGSWALASFNDPTQNQIGDDNIGFLPFPNVTGGKGSAAEVPANAGMPLALSSASYDAGAKAWLGCLAQNYGTLALRDKGQITGFRVFDPVADLPALTTEVQDIIANAPSSVLWFEALFSAQATTTAQTNGGLLAEGSLSGADFMSIVQADLG
jgi:raffinose/stachyose/melibiose transport system substrate-binding protein